jgi:endonuclease III
MPAAASSLPQILDQLESHYGNQSPAAPTDPYLFLLWWHCGYPPGDAACAKGWESLRRQIGVEPRQLLAATPRQLAAALKPGGLIPDLRAQRIKVLAARIRDEFAGDLRAALAGPLPQARKTLATFAGLGAPGIDRILLFSGLAPVPAVPSNSPHVLVRIRHGDVSASYNETYRQAQQTLAAELPETLSARTRAYFLLKHHALQLCKRTNPQCGRCPINSSCRFPSTQSNSPRPS